MDQEDRGDGVRKQTRGRSAEEGFPQLIVAIPAGDDQISPIVLRFDEQRIGSREAARKDPAAVKADIVTGQIGAECVDRRLSLAVPWRQPRAARCVLFDASQQAVRSIAGASKRLYVARMTVASRGERARLHPMLRQSAIILLFSLKTSPHSSAIPRSLA